MFYFILSFVLWAVVHSVTAASGPKATIRRMMGEKAYEGLYRLIYNIFSAITFLPVLILLATRVPDTRIWEISTPVNLAAYLVQFVGLLGLLVSLWQTDIWDFAGLRQAIDYLNGRKDQLRPAKLITNGPYALVRHPLYFFSLVMIWFVPRMTLDILCFNLLATLYFGIGSYYEEKRLLKNFGEDYREYKQRVPALLPVKLRR